jgi:sarcosine oxidase
LPSSKESGGTVGLTRRSVLKSIARCVGAAFMLGRGASTVAQVAASSNRWDSIVVGAGVFGAWTAWNLHRLGQRVLLLDAWGPAHARASSGGESRVTRTAYGADEVYTRMAWDSLTDWRWLSARSGLPVFHQTGVLFFFPHLEPYVTQTIEVHQRLKLPTQTMQRAELAKRFPQVSWHDIEIGLYEPELGALMARRAVQTLVAEFVKAGGTYRVASVSSPATPNAGEARLDGIRTSAGETLQAERYVFACGPWLPKVFPDLLGSRIFPTRQEVFFFAPPAGDERFSPGQLPTWADFNNGDIYYGMPDLEARGFKIAHDKHGPAIDPDSGDRKPSDEGIADVRGFMRRRFPALADRPMVEARVCQYENSSNGDLLIDRHPALQNVWLVGAGSGHGFKHAPAVGLYAAQLVTQTVKRVEPRFSLVSKAAVQQRLVH